jgi:hypothetical protein
MAPVLAPGAPHLVIYHFVIEGSGSGPLEDGSIHAPARSRRRHRSSPTEGAGAHTDDQRAGDGRVSRDSTLEVDDAQFTFADFFLYGPRCFGVLAAPRRVANSFGVHT